MKTLRILPMVLVGAVILGSVGCSNDVFSESLEDDFEITETSTEEFIGTSTREEIVSIIATETTIGNANDVKTVSAETSANQDAHSTSEDDRRQEYDDSESGENNESTFIPTPTPIPQSAEEQIAADTPIVVPESTDTPVPTATPRPMPEETQETEPPEETTPTTQPAVAAYVKATFIVYGGTDDDNPTYVESTVFRTYLVQPKDGCSYHSYQVSDYVCIDAQISWSDLDTEFYSQHPNSCVHGYDTVGEEVVGFVDD